MDFGYDLKPLKKRTACDYCGRPLKLRRYVCTEFKKVYCTEACLAEGRVLCIQQDSPQGSFFDIWYKKECIK